MSPSRTLIASTLAVLVVATPLSAQSPSPTGTPDAAKTSVFGNPDFNKEPTYIKSDTLTLKEGERFFVYSGNVEVKQADMTLTSQLLEGTYDENNRIQQLVAKNNVVIVKGPDVRAQGERAVYERATETVTLTENPELQQEGSILTADSIKIYLKEDRSEAQGAVRVKLVNKDKEESAGAKAPSLLPSSKKRR